MLNDQQKQQYEEAREALGEIILEVRQYLLNTEFAPEPFRQPVDPDKLKVEFPNQILSLKDIAILDKEQSLPPSPYKYYSKRNRTKDEETQSYCDIGYSRALEDVEQLDFRRILPKEE